MAELELSKIITGISSLFTESNHFVFWYDDKGEFRDNIAEISAQLSKPVIVMNAREQFKTKLKLTAMERRGESALVYSPAPRPALENNLLADLLYYSKTYAADTLTMLQEELKLKPTDKAFLKKYATFFASKERKKRFVNLNYNNQPLELVLLAALAKASAPALGAILRVVCQGQLDEDNATLALFKKYGALDAFWDFVDRAYGFDNAHKTPLYLFTAMLVNMAYDQAEMDLPKNLQAYQLAHANNAITFIQNTRNMIDGQAAIQTIANKVWDLIQGQKLFGKMDTAQLKNIDAFPQIDRLIIRRLTEQLLADDFEAQVDNELLRGLIARRKAMAYGKQYASVYNILSAALQLLAAPTLTQPEDLPAAIEQYVQSDYQLDSSYRRFTAGCSTIAPEFEDLVEGLQDKVENAYLNGFLTQSIHDWNQVYSAEAVPRDMYQRNFYRQFVSTSDERTVVLISDAFRFEAAMALKTKLDAKDVMTVNMHELVTGLPSVTYFGMPALLPNHQLDYDGDKLVLVDGQAVDTTPKRTECLQGNNPASVAAVTGDFDAMSTSERKSFLAGQKVVYLYDNRVDTTGEKSVTEQEVFSATEAAINHLARTVEILRNLSVSHIIVTADHGYIFRHSALDSANKIAVPQADYAEADGIKKEQRYVISERPLTITGVTHQSLGTLLGNDDTRVVNYPKNFDIFEAPGPSHNYVHGGSSAQEMIVPVLDIRTSSGRSQAHSAVLHDVKSDRRITSREFVAELMQDDAISDLVKPTSYQVYFVDNTGQKISGIRDVTAGSRASSANERTRKVRLTLKDINYTNGDKYTLVLHNKDTEEEFTSVYKMDLVTGGGTFGFDI